jgi:hypothetical protein
MSEEREPEVPDLGDEKYVRQRTRTAKTRDNIKATVLRNIMASVDGREWMFELLTQGHVYDTSFSPEPLWMAFWEGQRSLCLHLVAQIQTACPEQYLTMMKEAKDRTDVRD